MLHCPSNVNLKKRRHFESLKGFVSIVFFNVFNICAAYISAIFQHVVFFLKYFLDILIPDRSNDLQEKIKEEHFIVQNMLLKAEKEKFKKELQASKFAMKFYIFFVLRDTYFHAGDVMHLRLFASNHQPHVFELC